MGTYERLHWTPNSRGQTPADQRGCDYDAYLPDTLAGQLLTLDGAIASQVAEAEAGLRSKDTAAVSVIMPRLDLVLSGPGLRYLGRKAQYTLKVTNPGDATSPTTTVGTKGA